MSETRLLKITIPFAQQNSSFRMKSKVTHIKPEKSWDDLILPKAETTKLHDIADRVGRMITKADDHSKYPCVLVLFTGQKAGTGKTLAAKVLASKLCLDLYKVDLSQVISKYIGETEKNLEKIFNEADMSGAILFFDEADALFGKRSGVKDSHDRFSNLEVSYLLQRIEEYSGLVILATNIISNIDNVFLQRFYAVIDFPRERIKFVTGE